MFRLIAAITVVSVLSVGPTALAQGAGNGRIVGSVVSRGYALPGATVTVTGAGLTRRVFADGDGRFEFVDLPQGTYSITAALPGFEARTQQNVYVAPGRPPTVTLSLSVGCLETIDYITGDTLGAVQEADAIVHLRFSESGPMKRWTNGESCLMGPEYTSTLIRVLKIPPAQALSRNIVRFVQEGSGRSYLPGQEYVALLKWEAAMDRFHPIAGATFMFPVRDGSVVLTRTDTPMLMDAMSAEDFFVGLGALLSPPRSK